MKDWKEKKKERLSTKITFFLRKWAEFHGTDCFERSRKYVFRNDRFAGMQSL